MAADEVTDGTLGSVKVAYGKIMDGTIDGTNKLVVGSGGALEAQGDAAHDAAVAGNPVLVGYEAKDQDGAALPNAVSAEGDVVRAAASLSGVQYVMPVTEDGSAVATVNAAQSGTWNVTNVSGTVSLPTGAATSAKQDTQTTAQQAIQTSVELIDDTIVADDAAFTPATTKVMMAGFEFDDTTPDSVNEGDAGAARMSANRNVYTTIRDAAGNERGANVNASNQLSVSVDNTVTVGSHAVTNAGTFVVQENGAALTALQLIDDPVFADDAAFTVATSKVNVIGGVATADAVDAGDAGALAIDTARNLKVIAASNSGVDIGDVTINNASGGSAVNIQDGGNTITVDNGGTFAVQATAVGTVADDSTTPGAPVMIGGQAKETDGTDPGSVSAEDDVARVYTDRNRRLLVNTFHPNLWTVNDNQSAAQSNTVLKSAPGASLSLYITDVMISNGATAGDVRLVEDPAGTPVIKVPKIYLAINGGAVLHFETPIRLTANKALGYTSTTVTTHSVLVNGFIAP